MAAALSPLGLSLLILSSAWISATRGQHSLYDHGNPLLRLDGSNFTQTISLTSNAWVVEFYAAWCGHCQRFAPVWANFARQLQPWEKVVKVAAIACSDPRNAAICRQYKIWGYPTIKFFPPYTSMGYRGRIYTGAKALNELKRGSIDYIASMTLKPDAWPAIDPLISLLRLRQKVQQGELVFVFFEDMYAEDGDVYMGRELILDTSQITDYILVRMSRRNQGDQHGVTKYPSLYQLQADGSVSKIAEGLSKQGFRAELDKFSKPETSTTITVPEITTPTHVTTYVTTVLPTMATISSTMPSGLHMQDLESGLYYSLWLEVGTKQYISGPALDALKAYINTLHKYFPGNGYVMRFLNRTNSWLPYVRNRISGKQWVRRITNIQRADAYVPDRLTWSGCAGSVPRYRGYPCSLWKTFHALTVNAYNMNIYNPNFTPLEVLTSIRDFVWYFLGCRECAQHFLEMAENIEREARNRKDVISWLWKAHNKVNQRLHGDTSEDPLHPKLQFPPLELCPKCRTAHDSNTGAISWDEDEVIHFLRRFYGADYVIQDVLPFTYKHTVVTTQSYSEITGRPHIVTSVPPTPVMATTPRPPPVPTAPRTTPAAAPTRASTAVTRPNTDINSPPEGSGDVPLVEVEGATESSCPVMTTRWSACSVTCGVGVSTRMSNSNPRCRLEMEVRMCKIRPCQMVFTHGMRGSQCGATYRTSELLPLVYDSCRSLTGYYWRYCGSCPGRCCHPVEEETITIPFVCSNNLIAFAQVQMINYCDCTTRCP